MAPSEPRVVVAYHGRCFDGMASAAVLTRFLRDQLDGRPCFEYRGLSHQPGGSHVPEEVLGGDVNAVVDFRYTTSEKLTWWFDHHVSGLSGAQERAHFEADRSGRKFFDPGYGSCCKLIADVARERFGWHVDELADLIDWADIIDAARFRSARSVVELAEPSLQLMTVIEAHGDDEFLAPRIRELAQGRPLSEVASDPDVQRRFEPLWERHQEDLAAIRARAEQHGDVVMFDLTGTGRDRYNKLIPYMLFPSCRYSVAVSSSVERAKVSVGCNPWAPFSRSHDIAALCERYGGGGHPVVGAVSLSPGQEAEARRIAAEIVSSLSS